MRTLVHYQMAVLDGAFFLVLTCALVFGSFSTDGRHDCDRPCTENGIAKNCYYHFTLAIRFQECINQNRGECRRRAILTINGGSPGPLISVCKNDNVTVDVLNQLTFGLESSLHWHGLQQRRNAHMDGVPMITQCPIVSRTTFRYHLTADRPGTFYYHAHSVHQQLDGLFGAFVVRDRAEPTNQKLIMISPMLETFLTLDNNLQNDLTVLDLRSTVYDELTDFEESQTRIRLINAAALDCPVSVMTDSESLTLISMDGNEVKARDLNRLILNPGERADFLVDSKKMTGFEIIGRNLCSGRRIVALTKNPSLEEVLLSSDESPKNHLDLAEFYKKFFSAEPIDLQEEEDVQRVYLPFDARKYPYIEEAVDFRYKLAEITSYYPSFISAASDSLSVYQFINKSFLYPSSPILSQRGEVSGDMVCPYGRSAKRCNTAKSGFCECLHVLNLPYNTSIDLVLINEGWHGKSDQTVHIHGHSFRVLKVKSFQSPVSMEEVKKMLSEGGERLIKCSPIEKDTIAVPNNGYVVLRMKMDNPGHWLLESIPSKAEFGVGLELLIAVDDPDNLIRLPKGFPQCGSLKPQDVLIMDQ